MLVIFKQKRTEQVLVSVLKKNVIILHCRLKIKESTMILTWSQWKSMHSFWVQTTVPPMQTHSVHESRCHCSPVENSFPPSRHVVLRPWHLGQHSPGGTSRISFWNGEIPYVTIFKLLWTIVPYFLIISTWMCFASFLHSIDLLFIV